MVIIRGRQEIKDKHKSIKLGERFVVERWGMQVEYRIIKHREVKEFYEVVKCVNVWKGYGRPVYEEISMFACGNIEEGVQMAYDMT